MKRLEALASFKIQTIEEQKEISRSELQQDSESFAEHIKAVERQKSVSTR